MGLKCLDVNKKDAGGQNLRVNCSIQKCYGGCRVKGVWHTKVGSLALELIKAMRLAVLLSFHAAGNTRAGVYAAMQRMPTYVVQEIICAAWLQVVE